VLHEVHAQHSRQSHRRATIARLGVMRLDHCEQCLPRHDFVHRRQKHILLYRTTVLFESGCGIGR
jgi:hypothetical protein